MSDSSDSDVIHRVRHHKKTQRTAPGEFYDSEDASSAGDNFAANYDPIFQEVFGTGEEYAYIYEKNDERPEAPEEAASTAVRFSPSACHDYVRKRLPAAGFKAINEAAVQSLMEGYSAEYVAFHGSQLDVKECYYISDIVEEYKEYAQKTQHRGMTDCLRAYNLYKAEDRNLNVPGLLNISQYVENLVAGDRRYEPVDAIEDDGLWDSEGPATEDAWGNPVALTRQGAHSDSHDRWGEKDAGLLDNGKGDSWNKEDSWREEEDNWGEKDSREDNWGKEDNKGDNWGKEDSWNKSKRPQSLGTLNKDIARKKYQRVINQVSNNPVFQDRVYKIYESNLILASNGGQSDLMSLYRYYLTDESNRSNEVRRFIIEEAYGNVCVDTGNIEKQLLATGLIGGTAEHLCSAGALFDSLCSLTNAIASLQGAPGAYAGIFHNQKFCKIVLLGEAGEVLGMTAFRDNDYEGIRKYIASSTTICLASSSTGVKYVIQGLGVPVFYVPRSLSFFSDLGEYSVPCDIAALVQNPCIYFARIALARASSAPHGCERITARAVCIAAAAHKLDWRATLRHRHGHALLTLLGLPFSQQYFDYMHVKCLDALRSAFDDVQFANLCTYFVLHESTNALDATDVHPKDYSMAVVLCKGALHLQGGADAPSDDNGIVRRVLDSPGLLRMLTIPDEPANPWPSIVCKMLLAPRAPYFAGANDAQIFDDVVPVLGDGPLTAFIVHVGKDFSIVETGGASVYVRKAGEYSTNQVVKVRVLEKCLHMLNYVGEIVEDEEPGTRHFLRHRLFRSLEQGALQRLMLRENQNVMIRPSAQEDQYVVVCRVHEDLFYSLRVQARENYAGDRILDFHGQEYASFDEFLDGYVKRLYRTIWSIQGFKYFFPTEQAALEYLRSGGEYLKYAICFADTPGLMLFLFKNKKVVVKIDGECLVYRDARYRSLEEFISFAKMNFK